VRFDDSGKPSQTYYRTLELFEGFALVELELRTGRTHQIRVHMSHIGHPLAGDDMYGGTHLRECDVGGSNDHPLLTRQGLHAAMLGFRHPITNETLVFEAPLRSDLKRTVDLLRTHRFIRSVDTGGNKVSVPREGDHPAP
jgi:23S rRNA-/tRNA-specific pseudouridylate synthase